MNPPLTAGVLAHMPSFQAAIQIIQPLTDGAWEVLKPRLLSQREEAELRENDRLAQTRVVQERFDERRYQDPMAASDSKELVDREWDDVQAPLRARIGGYADETIHNGWSRGNKVNFDNCPKFAADVLIYVRKRFYAELAKDEAALRATGREPPVDPPNGPFLRKLVLENMKWVFDTKVKPHTEQYRKELFLCNACEANSKWYGFEGVIQHFAAKHTNALSVGSVVVHWKSEWPEYPPFNPDPSAVSNPSYLTTAPSASAPYAGHSPAMNYGYGGYQPAPVPASMPGTMVAPMQNSLPAPLQAPMYAPNPHGYQESPGPYYGHPQFGDQYLGQQNGQYPPPQPYQDSSQGYQQPQQYSAPPPATGGYLQSTQDYPQQGYNPPYTAPNNGAYPPPSQSVLYSTSSPADSSQHGAYYPQEKNHAPNYIQPPLTTPSNAVAQPPQKTEEYKAQLQEIARSARDTWDTINPIKAIPHPVKVYTIIHHLLVRSRESFAEDPPLQMIIDGLSNNKEMRPVRNIHGLACKACILGLAGSKRKQQKKPLSFPQLLNHFRDDHERAIPKPEDGYQPDWKTDMVELPEISKLTQLMNGPLKDDQRLGLVIEAIAELIPAPVEEVRNQTPPDYDAASTGTYGELAPSQDNHARYYSVRGGNEERPDSRHALYDQGEYDPSQPILREAPSREGYPQEQRYEISTPVYGVTRGAEERHGVPYQDRREPSYVEQRPRSPLRSKRPDVYESPAAREDLPPYLDRPLRYREPDERDFSARREPALLPYSRDTLESGRNYHIQNIDSHSGNRHEAPPVDDAARSRISDIIAQISQQALRVQERIPPREEAVGEVGSEDGELRTGPAVSRTESRQARPEARPQIEATNAAERFLDTFLSSDTRREVVPREEWRKGPEAGTTGDRERSDYTRRPYHHPGEPYRHPFDDHEVKERLVSRADPNNPIGRNIPENKYLTEDRPLPGQSRHAYEDRHGGTGSGAPRDRSPELVDRRYKVNNVVYRDERQDSYGTYRTPSRYARYESVRLENERARSRSPVYVKMGGQSAHHDERDPVGPPQHREFMYRTRTPPPASGEFVYERPPRQEYYRVYADEPRPRSPEAYELVRVMDEQGEYVIRRPIRRDPEPVYASYEEAAYPRQPIYESRPLYEKPGPIQRPDQPPFEEYDPRHPEPPPVAPVHQAGRY